MENTIATREEQKQEAIARMKYLKLYPQTIKEYEKEDLVNYSHLGILYWVEGEMYALMREFEKEHNALVYHIVQTFTDFGELLSFLYVSQHKDEWEYDRADLTEGYAMAYVKNLDDDLCSEFGSICIENRFGGLIRTA